MTHEQKLEHWAQREILRNLDHMILDQGGRTLMYGRYLVEKTGSGVAVWRGSDVLGEFTNRRAAVSYCVADRQRDYNLARRILQLDTTKRMLGAHIEARTGVADRTASSRVRDVIATKLQHKQSNYRTVMDQLEKCISRAKYLQLRGFVNETARTRRT